MRVLCEFLVSGNSDCARGFAEGVDKAAILWGKWREGDPVSVAVREVMPGWHVVVFCDATEGHSGAAARAKELAEQYRPSLETDTPDVPDLSGEEDA